MSQASFAPAIIAVMGSTNTGKSTVIKEAYTRITGITPSTYDIDEVVPFRGLQVAFCSGGDWAPVVSQHLENHANADILVLACRTKGYTLQAVLDSFPGKRLFIVGTAYMDKNVPLFNNAVADHISLLLQYI